MNLKGAILLLVVFGAVFATATLSLNATVYGLPSKPLGDPIDNPEPLGDPIDNPEPLGDPIDNPEQI